ncbi:MAG: DEAD/DEAH box helicase family protein [Azospirillum sp.]|nr:DEAD/DEAH box helicase family protein [Azospirillum sp.]
MKFKFDANETYQIEAIDAATAIFDGQPALPSQLTIPSGATFQVVPNRLDLSEEQLLENLKKVQTEQEIPVDDALHFIVGKTEAVGGEIAVRFPNLSVEMETGTGKTYVYLRTAHRLYQRYGFRKFVVVVPSVAIREGVVKTLKDTEAHFRELFGSPPYRFSVYDSGDVRQIRTFALSDGLEVMVMTIDAFKSAATVIRQSKEGLDPPIFQLQAARPILILDEPQRMESELSIAALSSLNPLVALRYSATHKNPYNVIYRLTPFDAYRQGLVKRIEVDSVVETDNASLPFLRLDEITVKKKTFVAKIAVQKLMRTGKIEEQVLTIKAVADKDNAHNLEKLTGRPEYEGFVIDHMTQESVIFTNGHELKQGQTTGVDREAIFEAQIAATVEEHFRKQTRLRDKGIKVLSLFFIDKVDSFRSDDGIIRKLFIKKFNEIKKRYADWEDVEPLEVQASYFASYRKKGQTLVVEKDAPTTKEERDAQREAFHLIMQGKEDLLSFGDKPSNKVAFIFSHSALREGWDNPNVFQICTMREVGTDTERRQQVGRGVRLPVTQDGERVRDEQVNVLTVVASETYRRFADGLQKEIEDAYGKGSAPPRPANKKKRASITLRKAYLAKPEFKELWDKIKDRTRYAVEIDSAKLISEVVPELNEASIRKPRITVQRVKLQANKTEDLFEPIIASGARTAIDLAGRYPVPNVIALMEGLLENTTPPMRLSRKTLLSIYQQTTNQQAALDNPHEFAAATVSIIKEKLADQLVNGIKYEKDGTWYEQTQFKDEIESWEDYIVRSTEDRGVGGTSLYDGIEFDSEIERDFALKLEKRSDVKLYIKLPKWFSVDTPVGKYEPDWAVVMHERGDGSPILYLVRETKSTLDPGKYRPDERRKITSGRSHFQALGVNFQVVTSAEQLPNDGA